jgi:signal peptidase I
VVKPRRAIAITIAIAVMLAFVALPFYAGTSTYPITIVEGNSMYPALQNGDLVVFHAVTPHEIINGTIIVFVEGTTGVTLIDQLLRPVIIHRVVGSVVQADGTIDYQTKGDNNQQDDPGLTPSYDVMGTPILVIPKVGILLLFVQSPQGLVAIVACIALFYVSKSEEKMDEDRKKNKLLGALARASLNGELPLTLFARLEMAVKYHDDSQGELKDRHALGLVDWIERGGLDHAWTLKRVKCPKCGSNAISLEGTDEDLIVCQNCDPIRVDKGLPPPGLRQAVPDLPSPTY